MTNEALLARVKQLPGETQTNFDKRVAAILYLNDKWILARNIPKPEMVQWRG